jgi:hypothetical protein
MLAEEEITMTFQTTSTAAVSAVEVPAIPAGKLVPWALLTAAVAVLVYYFIGSEQGATALFSGSDLHEFVHDARHLLGFPCH